MFVQRWRESFFVVVVVVEKKRKFGWGNVASFRWQNPWAKTQAKADASIAKPDSAHVVRLLPRMRLGIKRGIGLQISEAGII